MSDDRFVDALADHLDDPQGPAGTDAAGLDFEAVVAELRQESTWTGPPAGLRASILAEVMAAGQKTAPEPETESEPEATSVEAAPAGMPVLKETEPAEESEPVEEAEPAGEVRSAEEAQSLGEPEPPAEVSELDELRARRARRTRLTWGLTAVAAVAASFAAGVLTTDGASTPTPPPGRQFLAAGSTLAPSASATVTVAKGGAGFSVQLDLHNLPAAAPGSYYAAWLRGPGGLVPIGTFHGRRAGVPFKLWSGVDPALYPEFVVTLQSEGDPTEPSDRVVLRGTLR